MLLHRSGSRQRPQIPVLGIMNRGSALLPGIVTGAALPFVQSHAARIIRLESLPRRLLIRARRIDQQGEDKEQEPRVFGYESPQGLGLRSIPEGTRPRR